MKPLDKLPLVNIRQMIGIPAFLGSFCLLCACASGQLLKSDSSVPLVGALL